MEKTPHHRVILDMDSSESPVHGEQEGSAYNGHFKCNCYHPLFCFNQYGDCEGAMLRPGNVHSADRWKKLLEAIVQRLGLFVLAYNLGNFLRRLVLQGKIKHWSLRTLLVKLIKIGAKVLRHSRYVIFQMAKVAIRKEIFAEILSRISRLRCCSQQ